METYDVRCPICGELNHNLYLEETDGWMECEHCHQAVQILAYAKTKPILFIPAGSWQRNFWLQQSDKAMEGGWTYAGKRNLATILMALSKLR